MSKINTFSNYYKTNNSWLPILPQNWSVDRFNDLINLKHGYQFRDYDFTDEGIKIIKITQLSSEGYLELDNCSFIDINRLKEFRKIIIYDGDVLMALTGGTIGKIIRTTNINEPLLQNYRVGSFIPNKKRLDKGYMFYFLSSSNLFDQINFYINRNGQPNVGKENFKYMYIGFPPVEEQTQIAKYLDAKTQAIDKKINLLTTKIDYYKELRKTIINNAVTKGLDATVKLKESGIEWIGKIPEHWEVKRFKDVVAKYTTGGTPSTSNHNFFNGHNTWICISDIGESKIISNSNMKLTDEAIRSANMVVTPKGSLLYSFKLSIGKMAFVTEDVYTNEAILSIFPYKKIDLEYYYFMLPMFMYMQATENIYGAKMLNQKLISSAFILHPPKSEQTEISTYLDAKTSTIDKICTNLQTQIETLKELRKTLINDVVTGKVKIN